MDDFVQGILVGFFFAALVAALGVGDNTFPEDIQAAQNVCETNADLKIIRGYVTNNKVECNNGAVFELDATLYNKAFKSAGEE